MTRLEKMNASLAFGKEVTQTIINGVIGDFLEKKRIGLALPMELRADKKKVPLTAKGLRVLSPNLTGKICILAHGSCGFEKGWAFKADSSRNYGSLLKEEFGYTPFFLHYNSGLHISTNGKKLSALLEKLVSAYPMPVTEIILVGHSMGGLLFRSACHYGEKKKKKWISLVRKVFYIGTPHLGTHLEKLGKFSMSLLNQLPFTKLIASLGNLRSAGIKDLRHGYIVDEDWKGKSADDLFYLHQHKTPLLKSAEHYLICGTISKVEGSRIGKIFGDGLVHPSSGTGRGLFTKDIPFLSEHLKVLPGISHPSLQRSERVYEQIRHWCQGFNDSKIQKNA